MISSSEFAEIVYAEELYRIPPKTTIVLTSQWEELKADELEQFKKIAVALQQKIHPKLGPDGLTVVSVTALNLSDWIERPERLIYFGPPVKGLGLYEVIEAGKTKMVLSESLGDLMRNEGSRARLWSALKQLFES